MLAQRRAVGYRYAMEPSRPDDVPPQPAPAPALAPHVPAPHVPAPHVPEAEVVELNAGAPVAAEDLAGEVPLAVDIDGTLIATDLFFECAKAYAMAEGPVGALRNGLQMLWVIREGRPHLKRWLAEHLVLDYAALPWQEHILEFLRGQHAAGRRLILATAADTLMAERVALRLGIFDEVVASKPGLNLKSHRKAEALVEMYGERGFDYIGDALPDLKVWSRARKALVVSSQPKFIQQVHDLMGNDPARVQVFPSHMKWTAF